jgi:hypothetical protein
LRVRNRKDEKLLLLPTTDLNAGTQRQDVEASKLSRRC